MTRAIARTAAAADNRRMHLRLLADRSAEEAAREQDGNVRAQAADLALERLRARLLLRQFIK